MAGVVMAPGIAPPGISVVIPTRHRRAVLARTLRGWQQVEASAQPTEIIVVDDGSSDESSELVATVPCRPGTILRWFDAPARGPAAARNVGIRAAAAPVILFAGDDIVPDS